MNVKRARDGSIKINRKSTTLTVTFDQRDRMWNAHDGDDWLFEGRTLWNIMRALTALVAAVEGA